MEAIAFRLYDSGIYLTLEQMVWAIALANPTSAQYPDRPSENHPDKRLSYRDHFLLSFSFSAKDNPG